MRQLNKYLLIHSIVYIFLLSGCQQDPEAPEYLKYNWFANYKIGEVENSMYTNSLYNEYEPYISGFQSSASKTNPDGSEEIIYLSFTTGMNSTSQETDSVFGFEFQIGTSNINLLALQGKSKEEKITTLISYFKNRRFVPDDGDNVFLLVSDKFGKSYNNEVFNNGTYAVYLDYDIVIKNVDTYEHPLQGDVIRIHLEFNAIVREMIEHGVDQTLTADVRMYFPLPFE